MKTSFQPYTRRVNFAETDAAGIMHFARYPILVEEAVHDFWAQAGIPIFDAGGLAWPVVAFRIDYRSPARFGDVLLVEVGMPAFGRSSAAFDFTCLCGRRVVCEGRLTVCLADFSCGKSVKIPSEWIGKCGCNFSADGQACVSDD
jgi:acyl-CoA thioester hydrolase